MRRCWGGLRGSDELYRVSVCVCLCARVCVLLLEVMVVFLCSGGLQGLFLCAENETNDFAYALHGDK